MQDPGEKAISLASPDFHTNQAQCANDRLAGDLMSAKDDGKCQMKILARYCAGKWKLLGNYEKIVDIFSKARFQTSIFDLLV